MTTEELREKAKQLADWIRGDLDPQYIEEELQALLQSAIREAERYGRANEHHQISGILTNDELGKLSPATRKRLKDRLAHLTASKGGK